MNNDYPKSEYWILKAIITILIVIFAFLFFTKDGKAFTLKEAWEFYPASTNINGIVNSNKKFENVSNYQSGGFTSDNPYGIAGMGSMKGRYNYNSDWQATSLGISNNESFTILAWQKNESYDRTILYIDRATGENIGRIGYDSTICYDSHSAYGWTAGGGHQFGTITNTGNGVCQGTHKNVSGGYWNLWAYVFGSNYLKTYLCGYSEISTDECILMYHYTFSNTATTYNIEKLYLRMDNGFSHLSEIAVFEGVFEIEELENIYQEKEILNTLVSSSGGITYTGPNPNIHEIFKQGEVTFEFSLPETHCHEYYKYALYGDFYIAQNGIPKMMGIKDGVDIACEGSGKFLTYFSELGNLNNLSIVFADSQNNVLFESDKFDIQVTTINYSGGGISPVVAPNKIFEMVNTNLNCSVNTSCKINYYYNWNIVPEETNQIKIYDVNSSSFPLACWIGQEIPALPECELVGTYSIEDLSMFGKNNGSSYFTVSHDFLGTKYYLARATSSEFTTDKLFNVTYGSNAPIELYWRNLDTQPNVEPNYLFYKLSDLSTNNQRTLFFQYNYCGAGQEFDHPIFWIMGGAGDAYGLPLTADSKNSYLPDTCAGYGYFEVEIPVQEGVLYLDLGFYNEAYDGETLISRNLIFKSPDTTVIGIYENLSSGYGYDSDDWWITRQVRSIFNQLKNIFPFNILSGFLNAWNRSGDIVSFNLFKVNTAYAQSGDFNLDNALFFPQAGEGFEVIKIDNFANTNKSLSLSLFDRSAMENFIGSDFMQLMRGLLTMGLWMTFFIYLFFRIKNFDI
jgi:hypothetical protein